MNVMLRPSMPQLNFFWRGYTPLTPPRSWKSPNFVMKNDERKSGKVNDLWTL